MQLNVFIPLAPRSKRKILCAFAPISAGEAAEISTELEQIDLSELITDGRDGCYLIRASGDSMEHEIRSGDWLITNTNLAPKTGEIVIASINGDYFVKDFKPSRKGLMLVPKNENYPTRIVTPKDDFETFGVVVGIVRLFKKSNR